MKYSDTIKQMVCMKIIQEASSKRYKKVGVKRENSDK
jgi:hypothetical protein